MGASERERALAERWRGIESESESESEEQDAAERKQSWFSDAFECLMEAPPERHLWCGSPLLMAPLLETFHAFPSPPLRRLWARLSQELALCTTCVSHHHHAIDSYAADFLSDSVAPLLRTLHALDEDRLMRHLRAINVKLRAGRYDPDCDSAQVVSLMFEVFMFPVLLDDSSLATEFQSFIETIDASYELNLSSQQQYPVSTLSFLHLYF